jgi:hypothetical protein
MEALNICVIYSAIASFKCFQVGEGSEFEYSVPEKVTEGELRLDGGSSLMDSLASGQGRRASRKSTFCATPSRRHFGARR